MDGLKTLTKSSLRGISCVRYRVYNTLNNHKKAKQIASSYHIKKVASLVIASYTHSYVHMYKMISLAKYA